MPSPGITEAQFQRQITDLCDWLGLKWHHETDSRRSKEGFPDLVIAGTRLIFVELKSAKGKVSKGQREWLHTLAAAGVEVYVWRPSDLPEATKILRSMTGRTMRGAS